MKATVRLKVRWTISFCQTNIRLDYHYIMMMMVRYRKPYDVIDSSKGNMSTVQLCFLLGSRRQLHLLLVGWEHDGDHCNMQLLVFRKRGHSFFRVVPFD